VTGNSSGYVAFRYMRTPLETVKAQKTLSPCGFWSVQRLPFERPVRSVPSNLLPRRLMTKSRVTGFLALVVLAVTAGCESLITPQNNAVVDEGLLDVIGVADDAPAMLATEVSFWAVRGKDREIEMRYDAGPGYNGKCLRFVVPGNALLRRPDGSVIEPGDSVKITIRLVDPTKYLFEFDPGGLRFDPAYPARLEVRYLWAIADLNGDGVVDQRDELLTEHFALFRQERPGEVWVRLPTIRSAELHEVQADITGFTRYALASDRSRGR
jgi:hypothetical protein